MKAVLCKEWGDASTLAIEESEPRAPSASEVRITVCASGMNFADTLMIAGEYQFRPSFPFSPGFEVAGVIAEVGEDVEDLQTGDRVIAVLPYGGYAQEVTAPATHVVLPISEGMDFATAAAFPLAYGTAYLALVHRAHLKAGDVLVVHGGAGNVGRAAIEVGKHLNATVIATGGSEESLRVASEYGADHTIDYEQEDLRDRVEELTEGKGADVIFDPVGGDAFDASIRCVGWEGTILVIGFASGRVPETSAVRILLRNCAVVGTDWGGYLRRDPRWFGLLLQRHLAGMRKEH
jgi:NADPH2:quinone reductase